MTTSVSTPDPRGLKARPPLEALADARRQFYAAKINLQEREDEYRLAKAQAEVEVIPEDGFYGKNAEDRERFLEIRLGEHTGFLTARALLRGAQAEVRRLE